MYGVLHAVESSPLAASFMHLVWEVDKHKRTAIHTVLTLYYAVYYGYFSSWDVVHTYVHCTNLFTYVCTHTFHALYLVCIVYVCVHVFGVCTYVYSVPSF